MERDVSYHPQMLTDLEWFRDHDQATGAHVVDVIEEAAASPENGRGRPKRLRTLAGVWSRRITQHHRLFYLLDGEIRFLSCRGHDLPQHIYEALRAGEQV